MRAPDRSLRKDFKNKEKVMNDVRFSRPIRLHFQAGERLVASAWEAIECLRQQWPERADRRTYRAAYRACRDALDGWRAPQEARRAFMKAAESAGLLTTGARHA
jgi:ribosomal 50S subunit-associated protein YjgA (DUF615 family)